MINQVDDNLLLINETCVKMVVILTSDKRLAKQLADAYLSMAQAYRQMAGMEPIQTGNHRRKVIAECNR